ncbi:MAG: DNA repair protein RecO C-terminal domain-containing protein [Alloprevotella sp.]|nr:DNA repair protein RecO C-terminal domain-containing protein [Alloprevotella sp.]
MLTKSRGIVLHTLKYNDETLIADILTEREGSIGFAVRIPASHRAAVKPALLQPLALVELEWDSRPGRASGGLERMKSLRALCPYTSIYYEPQKSAIGLFLAEFLHHALHGEPPSEPMFNYVWQSLLWFDTCPADYANFHLVFLLRLSRFFGFYPNMEDYSSGAFFDLQSSTFCTARPSHPHYLAQEDACHLPQLMRMQYQSMKLFHLSGTQRSRLLRFAVDFYRLHLPQFPELKSLSVLQSVFA